MTDLACFELAGVIIIFGCVCHDFLNMLQLPIKFKYAPSMYETWNQVTMVWVDEVPMTHGP